MNVHFHCTQCGVCCSNIKIPLTAREALEWLKDSHEVQVICEATPWSEDRSAEDPRAAHVKRRSFEALSGTLPSRIVVILVANIVGDCPNLLPDKRCNIYERRPLVCQIYPAEINPFIDLEPSQKACPPEAWHPSGPLLLQGGRVIESLRPTIALSRDTDARETSLKSALCRHLRIDVAALAHEGFIVHSLPREELASALRHVLADDSVERSTGEWRYVSNRIETLDDLAKRGARTLSHCVISANCEYLGFKPASPVALDVSANA